MKAYDARFWIYITNAACGAAIAGAENLEQWIGLVNVELVQWSLGILLAMLNAARAYLDQHLTSRKV